MAVPRSRSDVPGRSIDPGRSRGYGGADMRSRRPLAALLVAGVLLAPTPARAGMSSEGVDGTLTVTGTDGNDVVQITCAGGDVTVNDRNPGTGRAACSDVDRIVVRALGGMDLVDLRGVLPVDFTALAGTRVVGGGGEDTLYGSPFDDDLSGSDGNDRLYASGGTDVLDGGGGSDDLRVDTAGDVVLTDTSLTASEGSASIAAFEQVTLRSLGRAVRFDLRGFRGRTWAYGAAGPDVLLGGPGMSGLFGGPGADRLIGRDGEDYLFGNDGPDVLRGGGATDRMDGGPGRDDCSGGPDNDIIVGCP
jgi:Ca2+-binding RTX toxin-like protein